MELNLFGWYILNGVSENPLYCSLKLKYVLFSVGIYHLNVAFSLAVCIMSNSKLKAMITLKELYHSIEQLR